MTQSASSPGEISPDQILVMQLKQQNMQFEGYRNDGTAIAINDQGKPSHPSTHNQI
jgi:hypothetical protein